MDHPQGEDQHGAAQGAPRQEFRREMELVEHVHGMDAHIKVDYKTIVTVTAMMIPGIALILGHAIPGTYSGSQATTQTQVQPTAQSKFILGA